VDAPEVVGLDALARVDDEAKATTTSAAGRPQAPSQTRTNGASPEAVTTPEPAQPDAVEKPSLPEVPAEPAHPVTTGDLLARAEEARRSGDYAGARSLYRQASEGQGATAEAACVALARMELSLGHAAQAVEATKQRRARFGGGTLAPEALWIDVRAYRQMGDPARAKSLAEELVRSFPSSPQAHAAEQWLSGG
jgi:hypothetical protein